jgi:hypothetical protein
MSEHRFRLIVAAYDSAAERGDDLIAAMLGAAPNVTRQEAVAALRWAADKQLRELRRYRFGGPKAIVP